MDHLYTLAHPLPARVVENRRLTARDNPNDVRHIVLEFAQGTLDFHEGQAVGVPPPGLNARGRPHPPRLFSVASARDGEHADCRTVALTVKRFFGEDPVTGLPLPGLASNFLCDSLVGAEIGLTGPLGKLLQVPDDPLGPLLLFATGTGIAPMRGFLQRRSRTPEAQQFDCALLHGAPTTDDLLYAEEIAGQTRTDQRLQYWTARSREQQDGAGQRLYVGQLALDQKAQLLPLLLHPTAHVLICGVSGMEDGIERAVVAMAGAELLATLKSERRWQVEVY